MWQRWWFLGVWLLVCGASAWAGPVPMPGTARQTLSLNGTWTITGPGVNEVVQVPSTQPTRWAVMRWTRRFTLALPQRPAVAQLAFAGVVNAGSVRLNGQLLGPLLAFMPARFEVAPLLVLQGENVLEVDLDDRLVTSSVPGGPTEAFVSTVGNEAYGLPVAWANRPGIIREVSLTWSTRALVGDAFADVDFDATLSQATLRVRVPVLGAPASATAAFVGLTLRGAYVGGCVALPTSASEVGCSFNVPAPALWSPASPTLHDLWVTLFDGPQPSDAVTDRLGLRRIEVRGNRLFLNNQPLFLRGISRHDMYGERGFTATPEMIETDLRHIKVLGANHVRAIHYPPDERVARRADEIGLLLTEEIPAWARLERPEVADQAEAMFRAMVLRDYNRASVFAWYSGSRDVATDLAYYRRMMAVARALDPRRLSSFVFDAPIYDVADVQRYAQAARDGGFDFYAQNGYSFWMPQTLAALPTDLPIVITEWSGVEGNDRNPLGPPGTRAFPDDADPWGQGLFPESFQAVRMLERLSLWLPYVGCGSGQPCVSGLVYFNWQDVPFPALSYFMAGHVPVYHNGLVYEDRGPKIWPLATFQSLMSMLPAVR